MYAAILVRTHVVFLQLFSLALFKLIRDSQINYPATK
jgi:hypothetical protein